MSKNIEVSSGVAEDRIKGDDVQLVYSTDAAKESGINRCPVCACEEWYVVQGPGQLLPIMPLSPDGLSFQGGAMHEIVSVACQQCGFIKAHLKPLFDSYVKQLNESANSN